MSLIRLDNITKTYQMGSQTQTVLRGLTLNINKGEFLGIMGESGSGKSTVMNIMGLLDTQTTGAYHLLGQDVKTLSDTERAKIRNKTIGFVFQQFFLLPKLSAFENVALPLSYLGIGQKEIDVRVMALLEKVGMANRHHHKPSELSGGQQQRVAIARALVCRPSLILADEPTGALDTATSQEVMNLFKSLHLEESCTIVMITHNPAVGLECSRCVTLKDGLLIKESVH